MVTLRYIYKHIQVTNTLSAWVGFSINKYLKKHTETKPEFFSCTDTKCPKIIGAKPNLYCEAIELVCGGSPKVCVLVEWKALDRVKSEV